MRESIGRIGDHVVVVVVVVALCAIFPVDSAVVSNSSRRIANGFDAPAGKYPFIVLVEWSYWKAVGCIINKRYVLVGALAAAVEPHRLTVIAATNDLDGTGGIFYTVERTIPHPGLDENNFITDGIGLLRVDRDIDFTPLVKPIRVACDPKNCADCPVTIVGWGRKTENKSRKLQVTHTTIVSTKGCVRIWNHLQWVKPERFLCTSKKTRTGLCCGDSGAAVISQGQLIAIGAFSIVSASATEYPDVHMRLPYYKSWIVKNSKLDGSTRRSSNDSISSTLAPSTPAPSLRPHSGNR